MSEAREQHGRQRVLLALTPYAAFFLSGASSLIFQMIWSRLLHHVFGSSSVAISSVVSVFMGGLALGAWGFGRVADRVRRPLLVYALAELGVAAFALAVPVLVDPEGWLADVNAALRLRMGAESLGFALCRFACIVPVLIVPTTLMGSTLPLLARHFVQNASGASQVSVRVGTLYAVNTSGAVLGVFLGGFVLMPQLGVSAANLVAASMNLGLAALILALRGPLGEGRTSTGAGTRPALPAEEPVTEAVLPTPPRVRVVAAVAFALSGACSLLYEVVWSRALVNTIGGSVYSFALILMTFLVGIAGGSALASGLLAAQRAARTPLAVVAVLMSVVAPLPLGFRFSALTWLAVAAASVGSILVDLRLSVARARADAELGAEDEHEPRSALRGDLGLLRPLVVPLGLSLGQAVFLGDRLSLLLGSALLACALLPVVLCLLRGKLVAQLASTQLFVALATLASDLWADEISLTFASMVAPLYHVLGEHVDRVMAMMFTTAALCVLPSALGMGAMFPLTMRAFSGGGWRVGRDVARVYTGNTVGSIVGAWLPGFVLMPRIGMQATLHVGIALSTLLALAVFLVGAEDPRSRLRRAVLSVPLALAFLVALGLATNPRSALAWDLSKMTLGVFRISLAKDVLDQETWGEPDLLYYRDGLATTVSVERWGRHYSLKNNGKVEASNGDDMPTQIMVASLPLLLHPSSGRGADAAIIGFGSGVTVGAAMQFPLRSVEVMELERSVVEASRFFADVNHLDYRLAAFPYVQVPRLRVINDDGRNYLASTHRRYDVIIGEPSNPWLTGVSDLFTADHFRIAKKKLKPGGVYCEWVQLYEMSPENVKTIYRTFASQFRHVIVFSAEDLSSDTVLVGSDAPLSLDYEHLAAGFRQARVAAELERAYVHSPYDLLARLLLTDRAEVMRYTELEQRLSNGRWQPRPSATNVAPCPSATCRRYPAPINTDDNALIEFAAPRDLIGFERYKGYLQTIYAGDWPYGRLAGRVRGLEGKDGSARYAELGMALLAHGRKREAADAIARARQHGPSATLSLAARMHEALSSKPVEPELTIAAPERDPALTDRSNDRMQSGYAEVRDWLARGDAAAAKRALESIPASLLKHFGSSQRLLRGYVLYKNGEHDLAVGELEAIARTDPEFTRAHPELYFFLGRAHDGLTHFDKALRSMRVYVEAQTAH